MEEGLKILVIAPHPDDEAIGVGGCILRHVSRGDSVSVIFMTSGDAAPDVTAEIREQEAEAAKEILGYDDAIFLHLPDGKLQEKLAGSFQYDILKDDWDAIYIPHKEDAHPDHRAVYDWTYRTIFKAKDKGKEVKAEVFAYEVWTPMLKWDCFTHITDFIEDKLAAIRAHKSQCKRNQFDMGAIGLNRFRGVVVGKPTDYVECLGRVPL